MPGGPIFPFSAKPATAGRVFPNFGGSGPDTEGLGVEASLGADSIWKLRWLMPPTLPTGTCKLVLHALANATSGAAKVNPKYAMAAVDGTVSPDALALTPQTVQTLTWAAGEANEIKEAKVTLNVVTVTAAQWLVMDLTFETSGWTLAAISTWIPAIIFE